MSEARSGEEAGGQGGDRERNAGVRSRPQRRLVAPPRIDLLARSELVEHEPCRGGEVGLARGECDVQGPSSGS